jgi:heat shock protein HspQ
VIRHRLGAMRGVIIDVDAVSRADGNAEVISLQEAAHRDQPFYYLLAETDKAPYIAYIPEQDLLPDSSGEPVEHPEILDLLERDGLGGYRRRRGLLH